MLDIAQRLLQLAEMLVQPRQPLVDEVGEFQPGVDRGAAVRVVALAGRRYGLQGPDLLDQAQLPVPPSPRGRVLVAQPLRLAPQLVGRTGTGRLGLDLDAGPGDAYS